MPKGVYKRTVPQRNANHGVALEICHILASLAGGANYRQLSRLTDRDHNYVQHVVARLYKAGLVTFRRLDNTTTTKTWFLRNRETFAVLQDGVAYGAR